MSDEGLLDVPAEVAGGTPASPRLVTPVLLRQWSLPAPNGSKYGRGQLVVVGGARTTPGAAMLAGTAALRMGAGRLSIAVGESVAAAVAVAVPECGTIALPEDGEGTITGRGVAEALEKELSRCDAVLIGPGLADPDGARALLGEALDVLPAGTPLLLDALGATVLPDLEEEQLAPLRGRLALSPNTGELARLAGLDDVDEQDVCDVVLSVAKKFGACVACNEWIGLDGRVWSVAAGDSGLATSGSGDVVAGAVAGLLSRGASLAQAMAWGKYTHAAAGDALAARYGRVGYLASELGPELPRVMRTLGGD